MKYTRFIIKNDVDVEEAWTVLESLGCQLLYSSEDDAVKEIFGYIPEGFNLGECNVVEKTIAEDSMAIDWHSQWESFGHDFYDGVVHVDVAGKELLLEPGPGFGNLSHPTTRLMLKLMESRVKDKIVVDIGSGSGVLALAALKMGAKYAYGIDIDPEANEHAKRNAQLNGLNLCEFTDPAHFKLTQKADQLCILMNMIHSEQLQAWDSLESLHNLPAEYIVSGLLSEERDRYLHQLNLWGWKPLQELAEEGWLAIYCKCNSNL